MPARPATALRTNATGRQAYSAINLNRIRLDRPLGFDLYLGTSSGGYYHIWDADDLFSKTIRNELAGSRDGVFVLEEQEDIYYDYLENRLRELVYDKVDDEPEEAASLSYELSTHAMKKVFDSPQEESLKKAKNVVEMAVDLIARSDQALLSLLTLARHDHYTYTHSCNVGLFSLGMVKQLMKNGQDHDLKSLGTAFFFHDLGKIMVGTDIINKPGKLNDDEWDTMRRHPEFGVELLIERGIMAPLARDIILDHHERVDGSGYPHHKKAADINVYGRICAVADVFDALTSKRSYKQRLLPYDAAKMMIQNMPGHFDQDVLVKFLKMFVA